MTRTKGLHQSWHLLRLLCLWSGFIGLAGCAAVPRVPSAPAPIPVHTPTLSCEQANRIAYRIVKDGGYISTGLTLASAATQGVLTGTKSRGEIKGVQTRAAGEDTVAVRITCGTDGVRAVGYYGKGPNSMNTGFPEYFAVRFSAMAELAEQGDAPPPADQTQVIVTPLKGFDAVLEFGAPVQAVLPVRVEATNTTARAYTLDIKQIILLTPTRERIAPLAENESTFPAPSLSSQTLLPGARITGYLYYPEGAYTGARGFLVEKDSKEREGFSA